MHAHKNRAGRFTARLGLESLEGRVLLSTTMPTPAPSLAPAVIQQTTPVGAPQVSAVPTTASYSYHWSVAPSSVITGTNTATLNHRSTGSVMVALYRGGTATGKLGGAAHALPVAVLTSSSSASDARPDHFNTPVTITLRIKDNASGVSGTVTFKGTITGTLSWDHSSLKLTFQTPLTKQIKLGKHLFTVTLKTGSLHIPVPGTTPALIGASVAVANAPPVHHA